MKARPKRPVKILDKNGAFHVSYLDRVKGGRYLAASFDKSSSTINDVKKWIKNNGLVLIKIKPNKNTQESEIASSKTPDGVNYVMVKEEWGGKIYDCVWKKGTKTCTKAKYLSKGIFTNV